MTTFTFSTTKDRLEKINILVDANHFNNTSNFINKAIDFYIRDFENKKIMLFWYYICIPLFFFLICIGITLFTANMFFYILTGLGGINLMIFIFLFFDRYKETRVRFPKFQHKESLDKDAIDNK